MVCAYICCICPSYPVLPIPVLGTTQDYPRILVYLGKLGSIHTCTSDPKTILRTGVDNTRHHWYYVVKEVVSFGVCCGLTHEQTVEQKVAFRNCKQWLYASRQTLQKCPLKVIGFQRKSHQWFMLELSRSGFIKYSCT